MTGELYWHFREGAKWVKYAEMSGVGSDRNDLTANANSVLLRNTAPCCRPDGPPESALEGSFGNIVWKPQV